MWYICNDMYDRKTDRPVETVEGERGRRRSALKHGFSSSFLIIFEGSHADFGFRFFPWTQFNAVYLFT